MANHIYHEPCLEPPRYQKLTIIVSEPENVFPANSKRYLCGCVVVSSNQLSKFGKVDPCHSPRYIICRNTQLKQTCLAG